MRKKRLDLRLLQKEVAVQIGVGGITIHNWETQRTEPPFRFIPRIIHFLGYDPVPPPGSLPDKLIRTRKVLGLTQKGLASRLRVDPTTLARWERGERSPSRKLMRKVKELLPGP